MVWQGKELTSIGNLNFNTRRIFMTFRIYRYERKDLF